MAMPCFVNIKAAKQGKIDGGCDIKGKEKSILAYEVKHNISIPTDPHTGLSSGKRIHGPMTVTKEIDKSSPKLYQALCTGEHLDEVKIDHYRVAKDGKEELYYTQILNDAMVVSMQENVPLVFLPENSSYRHMETISITYGKITWKHKDGVETQDSWKGN